MIWEELEAGLARLAAEGLRRRRRTLDAPCGPEAVVDGRRVVAFCSNDSVSYTHLDVYKRQT